MMVNYEFDQESVSTRCSSPAVFYTNSHPTYGISNALRVQEQHGQFEQRLQNVLQENALARSRDTFATWLRAYYAAHVRGGFVVTDNEYTLLKDYLFKVATKVKNRFLPILPSHLFSFKKRHNLKLQAVEAAASTLKQSRIATANSLSMTKEIVGDPHPEDTSFSSPYRILVPFSRVERVVMKLHCNGVVHVGVDKVYDTAKFNFIGITRDIVRSYRKYCAACTRFKNISEKEKRIIGPPLKPIVVHELFERWNLDLFHFDRIDMVDGEEAVVKCYVLQVVDHKSKLRMA